MRAVSGSRRESVLREAFKDLLKRWGRAHDLLFVPEHTITTPQKNRIYLDGALLHALRVPFGYWEAKDADDDLDAEIAAKSRKGYPRDNIIYSDDHTAVLIQDGHEVARVAMDDTDALYPLLTRFFAHERQEIADFNKAVKQFAQDLPAVLEALRAMIASKRAASKEFAKAEKAFLKHAQEAINPVVSEGDVQEMLIQHILTEDIFAKVFDNPDFHRQNNVASELYKLEEKLFARGEKSTLLRALSPYYAGIAQTAAVIQSHSEKQGFLKGLYENFYKVYNAKAADRLGVVYTPGEIVRFMIRSTDWLCEQHFGKNLVDRGVEILDPATGTGTFIVELLEHFRGNHDKLRHKYKEELHANEVAILPYYVANLNIEATYQAITGQFAEFENLCFVDTLDNVAALGIHAGHQFDLLGSLTDENIERIKKQNRRKISVIIGNPPYNAWQDNYNSRNPNRPYRHIDDRIAATYRKLSDAQNTSSLSDMYVRFWRWASDRLSDNGIVGFVCNSGFIDSVAFAGFRQSVSRDFSEIWIVNLKGNARSSGEFRRKQGGNIFDDKIKVGVAIAFLVRKSGVTDFSAYYAEVADYTSAEDKLSFIQSLLLSKDDFTRLSPDSGGNWITSHATSWPSFLQLVDPGQGAASDPRRDQTIFRITSNGLQTKRDEWAYGWNVAEVDAKMRLVLHAYNRRQADPTLIDDSVKWDRESERHMRSGVKKLFEPSQIISSQFRPFTKRYVYFDIHLNSMTFKLPSLYRNEPNLTIGYLGIASQNELAVLGTDKLFDMGLVKTGNGSTQGVARYRYTKSGERIDNITDWALNKFVKEYGKKGVTKDAIFHYVYAVLHDPIYRETYALNLKREFPRIPFYPDFAQWAAWGEALMALHIGYEDVAPWPVERIETPGKRAEGTHPKPILKSQPEAGVVVVDGDTQITGIPPEAWTYRLGNRSAIDWVLDQHKEKKPRDPTIAAKFNTYRFADYKESMIVLLAKVVRVSMETVAITDAMRAVPREE